MHLSADEFSEALLKTPVGGKIVYARTKSLARACGGNAELKLMRKLVMDAAEAGKVFLYQRPYVANPKASREFSFEYTAVKMAVPKGLRPKPIRELYELKLVA